MGDDWKGKFDEFHDVCEVIYFQRTRLYQRQIIELAKCIRIDI